MQGRSCRANNEGGPPAIGWKHTSFQMWKNQKVLPYLISPSTSSQSTLVTTAGLPRQSRTLRNMIRAAAEAEHKTAASHRRREERPPLSPPFRRYRRPWMLLAERNSSIDGCSCCCCRRCLLILEASPMSFTWVCVAVISLCHLDITAFYSLVFLGAKWQCTKFVTMNLHFTLL